jgi:23S rRNA pseudouridine2605 synthase
MTSPVRNVLSLKRAAAESDPSTLEERLHKVLATAGLGSRRMLEARIEAGEVQVNGAAASLGLGVKPGDRVELDGKRFVVISDNAEHAQVIAYNKPEGVVTTREDPEGRPTVFEQLPRLKGSRWIAVGRLDINTTGLLLLTTDGDLANALMHPRSELEREYICRVHGEVPDEVVERLRSGVDLEDGPAHFDEVAVISRGGSHSWFRVVIREGRNREVRRMWEAVGLMVSRLKRIRYANVELPRLLKREHSAELDAAQVKGLRELAGAAESNARLTLAPVIGQRRSSPTEFRPDPKGQQAWTGTRTEEAREFGQFDRIRDDGWRAPSANKGKRSRGGGGPRPGNKGRPAPRGPAAGSQYVDPGLNPAILRSWFPDSPVGGARKGRGGPRPQGGGTAFGTPPAHGNANGNVAHGNRPPRGDFAPGNRAPRDDAARGNRGPRNEAHGNRPPRADQPNRPARGNGPRDDAFGNRPPRSNAPRDDAFGNRPPRSNAPRDDAFGNRPPRSNAPRDDAFGNRAPRGDGPRDDAFGNRAPRGNSAADDTRGNRAPPREGNRGNVWSNRSGGGGGGAGNGNAGPRRNNGPQRPGGGGPRNNNGGPRGNSRGPGGPRRPS